MPVTPDDLAALEERLLAKLQGQSSRVEEEAEDAREEWEPTLEAIPEGEDERSDSFQSCQEGGSSGSDNSPGE